MVRRRYFHLGKNSRISSQNSPLIPTSQVRWFNKGVFRHTENLPATLSQEAAEINQNEEKGTQQMED